MSDIRIENKLLIVIDACHCFGCCGRGLIVAGMLVMRALVAFLFFVQLPSLLLLLLLLLVMMLANATLLAVTANFGTAVVDILCFSCICYCCCFVEAVILISTAALALVADAVDSVVFVTVAALAFVAATALVFVIVALVAGNSKWLWDIGGCETMYRPIRTASKLYLAEYISLWGESKLERFHNPIAHYANSAMNEDLCDNLNLTGTCCYNVIICHKIWLAKHVCKSPIPVGLQSIPAFFNHTELAHTNTMAVEVGYSTVPFTDLEVLEPDNGERFFSEYFHKQDKRNKEYKNILSLVCPCFTCNNDNQLCQSSATETATGTNSNVPIICRPEMIFNPYNKTWYPTGTNVDHGNNSVANAVTDTSKNSNNNVATTTNANNGDNEPDTVNCDKDNGFNNDDATNMVNCNKDNGLNNNNSTDIIHTCAKQFQQQHHDHGNIPNKSTGNNRHHDKQECESVSVNKQHLPTVRFFATMAGTAGPCPQTTNSTCRRQWERKRERSTSCKAGQQSTNTAIHVQCALTKPNDDDDDAAVWYAVAVHHGDAGMVTTMVSGNATCTPRAFVAFR